MKYAPPRMLEMLQGGDNLSIELLGLLAGALANFAWVPTAWKAISGEEEVSVPVETLWTLTPALGGFELYFYMLGAWGPLVPNTIGLACLVLVALYQD